jgi:hypothetical protein
MRDNYEEAADVLKKVQDQFVEIGTQLGAACGGCKAKW